MRHASFALLGTMLAACGSEPGSVPARIAVEPGAVVIKQGDSVRLVASVLDEDGASLNDLPLTYESDDTTRVRISSGGMVKSVGDSGLIQVRVAAGGLETRVPVTVVQVRKTMTLTAADSAIPQLGTVQLTARVLDPFGKEIVGASIGYYAFSNLISISQTGLVTSLGQPGSVTVTAYTVGLSASLTIQINQVPSFIYISPIPPILGSGGGGVIDARVFDAAGNPMPSEPITYTPANPSLININSFGVVTSLGLTGATLVTITSGPLIGSITVTIVPAIIPAAVDSISGSPSAAAISSTGDVYVVTWSGTVERATLASFTFTPILQGLGSLQAVAFNQAGTEAYVAGDPTAGLRVIDVATGTISGSVGPVVGGPRDIVVDNAGIVYLSTDAAIYAIDPVSRTILDQASVSYALYLDVHPSLPLLYAAELSTGRLREISTTTMDIVRNFQAGGNPIGELGVSLDGTMLYSADEGSGVVTLTDLGTALQSYIPAGCTTRMLLPVSQSSQVYVGCAVYRGVNVVDLVTRAVVMAVDVSTPGKMARSADGLSIVIPGGAGEVLLLQ